jgi:hypothetical protein
VSGRVAQKDKTMSKSTLIKILKDGGRIGRYGHVKNAAGETIGKTSRNTINALENDGSITAENQAYYVWAK